MGPNQQEITAELIKQFGGVEAFAKQYVENLLAMPPGSQERKEAMDQIIDLIKSVGH